MAQYRYARNESGTLFDIKQLSKPDREKNRNHFFCCGCGQPMKAALGDKNEHYFSHKSDVDEKHCNKETYLHWLGKRRFIELFERHKESGEPFFLAFRQQRVCDNKPCPFGRSSQCKELKEEKFEIYPTYNQCVEESWNQNYIPDILLKTSDGNQMYVEIFVTHPCSGEKLSSGFPIIELSIKNEKDLDLISDNSFAIVDNPKIKFYNNPLGIMPIRFICDRKKQDPLSDDGKRNENVKDTFTRHFQWLVKNKSSLIIPYQMDYFCKEEKCPYLPIHGCACKRQERMDVAKYLPIIIDEGLENRLILKNEWGKALTIDFVEFFRKKDEYNNGQPVVQYLIKDILGGHYDRVECFNMLPKKKPCQVQKYIFAYLLLDGSLKIKKDNLEKIFSLFVNDKTFIKDYVLIDESSFRAKISENEIIDELSFDEKLYNMVMGYFLSRDDCEKNCSHCFHMMNAPKEIYACDKILCTKFDFRGRLVSYTKAKTCEYYEPMKIDQNDKNYWKKAIDEMYNKFRFK